MLAQLIRRVRWLLQVDNGSPNLICSVIEELCRRGGLQVHPSSRQSNSTMLIHPCFGLQIALRGRTAGTLEPTLKFVARYIANPRYTNVLTTVAEQLLDLYATVRSRAGWCSCLCSHSY